MSDWFAPRRRFGWGWTPVSWQGWLVVAAIIGVVVAIAIVLRSHG